MSNLQQKVMNKLVMMLMKLHYLETVRHIFRESVGKLNVLLKLTVLKFVVRCELIMNVNVLPLLSTALSVHFILSQYEETQSELSGLRERCEHVEQEKHSLSLELKQCQTSLKALQEKSAQVGLISSSIF